MSQGIRYLGNCFVGILWKPSGGKKKRQSFYQKGEKNTKVKNQTRFSLP